MSTSGHARSPRRRALLPLAALLGAAVVVLPSVAGSETAPLVEAKAQPGGYGFEWSPMSVTITAGGLVAIKNPSTETNHGVEWKSGPVTPVCSNAVPVGTTEVQAGKNWSGTCTFTQPGTYTFWCTVHHYAMRATITVNAKGEPTSTTSPPPSATTPGTPEGSPGAQPGPGALSPGAASLLLGASANAVKVAPSQHGRSVLGSVAVSDAGARGRLEVDLLASPAALARAGHRQASAGKLVLTHLRAGRVSFAVALNARARSALRRHHRLALSVRIEVSVAGAPPARIKRSVLLRP
jgi:plastocyanin